MGLEHTIIIHNLYDLLRPVVRSGFIHGYGLKYILAAADDGSVIASRTPDLAFLRRGRIPDDFDRRRPFPGAPDLAVEVASPGQSLPTLLDKVADYLRYGSEEVWMIYPQQRELHRYRQDSQRPQVYAEGESFTPDALFPGVTVDVSAVFADDVV